MEPIIYGNFFTGQSGLGKLEQSKFYSMTNCDIHTEVGMAMPQLALTSESTTPNEACFSAIDPSGNVYFFSKESGKVWKRTTAGSYSLLFTNENGAHRGARYFNGNLWFWTSTKLGYIQITGSVTITIASPAVVTLTGHGLAEDTPITFLTTGALPTGITAGTTYYVNQVDANTFNVTSTTGGADINTSGSQSGTHTLVVHTFATGTNFREGIEANNTLLIANGRYVARIDSANSVALQELTLPAQYNITCMKQIGDDVLIGTYVSTDVSYCRVFLWDTVSPSWTYEDEVFEIGINCFVQLDNLILAQCGTAGRFYYWNGSQMIYFGKIRGITTALGEQMSTVYKGRALFANATKIYSIHREDGSLPFAICGEYTATGTIASLITQGSQLLVSVGTGVDKVGTTYATAVIETPEAQKKVHRVEVKYDVYPEGIGIRTKVNNGSYTAQTEKISTNEMTVSFDGNLLTNVATQVEVTLTPSGSDIPKIKSISLY